MNDPPSSFLVTALVVTFGDDMKALRLVASSGMMRQFELSTRGGAADGVYLIGRSQAIQLCVNREHGWRKAVGSTRGSPLRCDQ